MTRARLLGLRPLSSLGARLVLAPALAGALLLSACQGSVEDRLAEIRALQEAGQFKESVEPLTALLKDAPESVDANYLLGIALMQTSEPSRAIYPLDRAMRGASGELGANAGMILASAYLQTESYDDAVRTVDRVLQLDPNRAQAVYMRGRANFLAGRKDEALIDAERLVGMTPEDYSALLLRAAILLDLGRTADAEQAYVALREASKKQDPAVATKGWLSLITFYYGQKNFARTDAEFSAILKEHPNDPLVLQYVTQFYDETNRSAQATALWQKAMANAPDNLSYRVAYASRLAASGQADQADAVLVEGTEIFANADAWLRLAELRDRRQDFKGAVTALEKAIELSGGGNDSLRFKLADVLANAGDRAKAREIVQQIGDESFRALTEGRLLLDEGDAKGALDRFDAGLRRWPNNAGARYLAGRAALQIGDFDRAASELREAFRAEPEKTDAALALAALELQRGKYREAVDVAGLWLDESKGKEKPNAAEAHLYQARALAALGNTEAARKALAQIDRKGAYAARAAVELAAIERKEGGPKAAANVIVASGLDLADPANELALRALADDLAAQGDLDGALARVRNAAAKHPESAALLDLQGRLLARAGRVDEARALFDRALAADPKHVGSLVALAEITRAQGDAAKALALLARAHEAAPEDAGVIYAESQILLASGRAADAEARLREVVRRDPGHAAARNDLAWLLAEKGQELELALRLATEAAQSSPTGEILDTLGWVQFKRNELDDAVKSYEKALAAPKALPGTRYRLALALDKKGDRARAVEELKQALGGGAFPEAAAAKQELARLEGSAQGAAHP